MEPKRDPVARLALEQHGLVSRRQLSELGVTAETIKSRVRTGRLTAVRRGVYALGVAPESQLRRWMAATLACPGTVLSHSSAAALLRLRDIDPAVIDVSSLTRGHKGRSGIRVHRPTTLTSADITTHQGIPVTKVARTLIDLAAQVSTRTLERATDEAQYLGLLSPSSVAESCNRAIRTPGAAKLRKALNHHTPGTTRTRSRLEELFLALVRANGLPSPEVNVRLGPYEIDFLWRERRFVVETDGRAAHERVRTRERDASRDAWLAARGYTVRRFTWLQVTERPDEVLAALGELVSTTSARS